MHSSSDLSAQVRVEIYRFFLDCGRAPSPTEVAAVLRCSEAEAVRAYETLAGLKVITLDSARCSIRMAHPFSAVPTPYSVQARPVSYWACCAWDALGIAAMLGRDTQAPAQCPDCGETIDLSVRGGSVCGDGVVHFAVPAEHFWDNIEFT